jgi:hypothetical protein
MRVSQVIEANSAGKFEFGGLRYSNATSYIWRTCAITSTAGDLLLIL